MDPLPDALKASVAASTLPGWRTDYSASSRLGQVGTMTWSPICWRRPSCPNGYTRSPGRA